MNSGEFLDSPSELGSQHLGRGNPNGLSETGQEKIPRNIRSRVRRTLLALPMIAVAALATAQGNEARADGPTFDTTDAVAKVDSRLTQLTEAERLIAKWVRACESIRNNQNISTEQREQDLIKGGCN